MVAVFALVSLVMEASGVFCRAGHWELVAWVAWQILIVPTLPYSWLSLYISALPVSEWGETEVLWGVPKGWGIWLSTPPSLSKKGNSFYLESSLSLNSTGLGDGVMEAG